MVIISSYISTIQVYISLDLLCNSLPQIISTLRPTILEDFGSIVSKSSKTKVMGKVTKLTKLRLKMFGKKPVNKDSQLVEVKKTADESENTHIHEKKQELESTLVGTKQVNRNRATMKTMIGITTIGCKRNIEIVLEGHERKGLKMMEGATILNCYNILEKLMNHDLSFLLIKKLY